MVVIGDRLGEFCFFQKPFYIWAASLHKVLGNIAAQWFVLHTAEVFRVAGKFRFEQGEQGTESLFFAGVRGGGDQDQVSGGVLAESFDQFMTLVAATAKGVIITGGVGFIHDD